MKNAIIRTTSNITLIATSLLLAFLAWAPSTSLDIKPASPPAVVQIVSWHISDPNKFLREYLRLSEESNVPTWAWTKDWKPCEYEDSNNCVWNAKRRGMGGGTSFIVTTKKRVIYIEHYEAYRLTHDIIRTIYAPRRF